MTALKNNIDHLKDDTESLAKNYLKLLGLKQSERLAVFLGILTSGFIISILLSIVVVFSSFVLAGYLNDLLTSEYWGYFIVSGLDIAVVILILLKIKKSGSPLFVNFFVKFILPLLSIETNQNKDIEGLRIESENVKEKIESEKKVFIAHSQLLKYTILEDLLKEVTQMFTSKKKTKAANKPVTPKRTNPRSKNDKLNT